MSIAFVTMFAGDHIWLQKWIRHNEQFVENRFNLYVILDGDDHIAREMTEGCSVIVVPRIEGQGNFDDRRMGMIHSYIAGLLKYYKVVVFNDVDEYLCIHPDAATSLVERLTNPIHRAKVVSPVGFEPLFQDGDEAIDLDHPLLAQRPLGYLNSLYCKPCIFYQAIESGNQHVIQGEPWVFDTDIFLFHCRYVDEEMLLKRVASRADLVEAGYANVGVWEKDQALRNFDRKKQKFLATPEQELSTEHFEPFINVLKGRYKKGKGPGERTFGRFRVPEAMFNAL